MKRSILIGSLSGSNEVAEYLIHVSRKILVKLFPEVGWKIESYA